MRALLMTANLDEVILDQLQDPQSLLYTAVGKQLLEEVVAILVDHDLRQFLSNFN